MLTLKIPQADASLDPWLADDLIQGLSAGSIPFYFDLMKDRAASHADAAYTDGQAITDLSLTADGDVDVAVGDTVTSGVTYGGADFSAIETGAGGTVIRGPTTALSAIHAGAQHFMVVFYAILPSAADWNSGPEIAPMFQSAAAGYINGPDLVSIVQAAGGATLQARRQTNGGTGQTPTEFVMEAASYARVAQVAYWRNADGVALHLRTAATRQFEPGAVGSDNSGVFSATRPQWGLPPGFASDPSAANFTLLAGWIENLEISGRNPRAVLDAHWNRNALRLAAMDA